MKRLLFVLLVLPSLFAGSFAVAEEPAEDFLEALRDQGYLDVALDYLDRAATSSVVSDAFRKSIPFEKAEILIASSAKARDVQQMETILTEAESLLAEYGKSIDDPASAAKILRYEGRLQQKQAQVFLAQAESDRLTDVEKQELREKSKQKLTLSLANYRKARANYRELIQNYQIDPEDPNSQKDLKRLQGIYIVIRGALPEISEALAETEPESSPNRKKLLVEAEKEYADLYSDYRKNRVGVESALGSGRTLQKLGEDSRALAQFEEVLKLGNSGALKPIKKEAMLLSIDSWNKVDTYPYENVVEYLSEPISLLNRAEETEPDYLRIKLELAKASLIKSNYLKEQNLDPQLASDLKKDAAKLAREVASRKSPSRDAAVKWMEQWNISARDTAAADSDQQPPESFDEAIERANEIVATLEPAMRRLAKSKSAAGSPGASDAAATEVEKAQSDIDASSDVALKYLSLAIAMATPETSDEQINNARYLQSFCLFAKTHYLESSLIGEFLLTKYPSVNWSRQACALMLRSDTAAIDNNETGEPDSYAAERLIRNAEAVIARYPGSDEAGLAASTMTRAAIGQQQYDRAREFFAIIPAGSAYRNVLAAQLGQQLWRMYRVTRSEKPDDPSLPGMLEQARSYLTEASTVANPAEASYIDILSSLYLVEVLLESGDTAAATAQLETAPLAPIGLIKSDHPAIAEPPIRDSFRGNAWRVAIKVYLASLAGATNPQPVIDKVTDAVAAMSDLSTGDEAQRKQSLAATYRFIAANLNEQFEQQPTPEAKGQFATSVKSFFDSVGRNVKDAQTLLWSGSSLLSMSESLAESGASDIAKDISRQAIESLEAAKAAGFDGPNDELMYEQQLALAKRGSGDYEAAVSQFVDVLKKKSLLNLQIDAAKTLYMWGINEENPDALAKAMMGTEKFTDPKTNRTSNVIWGWRTLVQATRGKDKFNDIFGECLYYSVQSRYQYGKLSNSQKAIDSAKGELEKALQRFGFLSNGPWKAKYDALLAEMNAS